MGFYRDGKWVFEPMDAGNGACSAEKYTEQRRDTQKKLDDNNAGEQQTGIKEQYDKCNRF